MIARASPWRTMSRDEAVALLARCADCGVWFVDDGDGCLRCLFRGAPRVRRARPDRMKFVPAGPETATPCGRVAVYPQDRLLVWAGKDYHPTVQALAIFAVLADAHPRLVDRDELHDRLWPLAPFEAGRLRVAVHYAEHAVPGLLRKVLVEWGANSSGLNL